MTNCSLSSVVVLIQLVAKVRSHAAVAVAIPIDYQTLPPVVAAVDVAIVVTVRRRHIV